MAGGTDAPESSDDGTDGEYTTVTRRRRKTQTRPAARKRDVSKTPKPPAELIKVAEGETFESTLRAVQTAVDLEALGVDVKRIARTQEGHLLVEMKGGSKAAGGAEALSKAVSEKAIEHTGKVIKLGTSLEVEVIDINPSAREEEVFTALATAVGKLDGLDLEVHRTSISVTGLWQVKNDTKIASAKIPRAAAKLETVKIGLTVARVRPRRPEPQRCYRCHGFGHSSSGCKGPELIGKCRRCGGAGHLENNCTKLYKCVVCDRLGVTYRPHKFDSGGCQAKFISRKASPGTIINHD